MLDQCALVPAAPLDFGALAAGADAVATAAERTAQGLHDLAHKLWCDAEATDLTVSIIRQTAYGWDAFAGHMRGIADGSASVESTPKASQTRPQDASEGGSTSRRTTPESPFKGEV